MKQNRCRFFCLLPLIFLSLFLGACSTLQNSLPDNYVGPKATISDSVLTHSASKHDFFVVIKVDGREIKNSHAESIQANLGRGFAMTPVVLVREIPASKVTLELRARTEYAAPILALTNKVYQVLGQVSFEAKEGAKYQVKGILTEEYSAVWIEDIANGETMGDKIEVKGSAKLGFFKK